MRALGVSPLRLAASSDATISAEAPGVALHLWTGEFFVTHHAQVGAPDILARYDRNLQPLVQALAEEHDAVQPGAAAA